MTTFYVLNSIIIVSEIIIMNLYAERQYTSSGKVLPFGTSCAANHFSQCISKTKVNSAFHP